MLSLATLILHTCLATVAARTCYGMNGVDSGSDAGLCDPSAKGTAGSHSACCSVGNGDACLSTGLCLSSWSTGADGLLWASGCTDPTWQDASCASFCVGKTSGKTDSVYALLACSNTTWCCSSDWQYRKFVGDKTECCKNTITLPTSGVGSVVRLLGSAATNSPNPSTTNAASSSVSGTGTATGTPNPSADSGSSSSGGGAGTSGTSKTAAGIVAGVLGTALLASLVVIIILAIGNRKLRRQLRTSQPVPVGASAGYNMLQTPNKSELSTTPAPSFSPLAVPLGRPELGGNPVGPAELANMSRVGYN